MAAAAAPAFAIAFWRNAAASVLIAPVALARSRAELTALGRRHWMATALAGVALAGHFATWVSALKLTSVAAATALVCAQIVLGGAVRPAARHPTRAGGDSRARQSPSPASSW